MEQQPQTGVSIRPDGPYVVRGVPLTRRRPVVSEHGEPMTWETTGETETDPVYALCRCGGSASKPFCDGTHASNGFDGSLTATRESYDSQARVMAGTRVVVRDDRKLCEHAGFCGNRVTNVWDMVGETEDSVTRNQLMSMIERCPSGALTYRLETDGPDIEPELRAEVGVVENGPLFVSGRITVDDPDGNRLETRNRVTLCRCGASKNKPYCDGSHTDVDFRG